jgi:ankyrin repeat protein
LLFQLTMSERDFERDNIRKSIPKLIEEGSWDTVRQYYEAHPEDIKGYVDSNGATILHAICYIASAPIGLLDFVMDTWPEALTVQENRYGATPLHVLCWSSQKSVRKIEVLLKRMDPNDLMIKNRILGSTALHSACGNGASDLDIIKAIVRKHPPVVLAKTFDQKHTAVNALWHAHLQSIQGHMQVARILEGDEVNEEHFERFWAKCKFLAVESFKQSPSCPEGISDDELPNYVLHGLMDLKAPLNCMKMAIKINPSWASYADVDGNYPLHHVVMRRPFRVKDIDLIRSLLEAWPDASTKINNIGDAPIHIAIRDRMVWEEGLGEIVRADIDVLGVPDAQSGLYPFLLSATLSGKVAVNTTFQLLLANPYLVKDASGSEPAPPTEHSEVV